MSLAEGGGNSDMACMSAAPQSKRCLNFFSASLNVNPRYGWCTTAQNPVVDLAHRSKVTAQPGERKSATNLKRSELKFDDGVVETAPVAPFTLKCVAAHSDASDKLKNWSVHSPSAPGIDSVGPFSVRALVPWPSSSS